MASFAHTALSAHPTAQATTELCKTSLAAQGDTELHTAILRGKKALIRKLVQGGADLSIRNSRGRTPLDLALLSERKGVLLSFLRAVLDLPEAVPDAVIETLDTADWTLVFHLPDSNLAKKYGGSVLAHLVSEWRKDSETRTDELRDVLDYLQKQSRGHFIYQADLTGRSGLYYAVEQGDLTAIDLLLENGLKPTYVGEVKKGVTPSITPAQLALEKLKRAEENYQHAQQTEAPETVLYPAEKVAEARAVLHALLPQLPMRTFEQSKKPLYQ